MSKAYFDGLAAGIAAFRLTGPHDVPADHPHGADPEGAEWFLGCCRGLQQCDATFRSSQPPAKAPDRLQPIGGGV